MLNQGEYLLGHIYRSMTIGMSNFFRTKLLRFEVAIFNCAYNAIIWRPRLAKFMAIPYYSYLVLKMSGPHDIVSEKENFKETVQPRGNLDALLVSASVAQKRLIVDVVVLSKDSLPIPVLEVAHIMVLWLTKETKKASLGLSDTSKMVIVCSTLPPK